MKTLVQLVIGMIVLGLIGVAYLNMPMQWRRHKDIELGDKIIANITQFQQKNRRLPENTEAELLPLGFHHNKQGWQPNYIKINANQYEIRFQDGFTSPYLHWQSDKKIWVIE